MRGPNIDPSVVSRILQKKLVIKDFVAFALISGLAHSGGSKAPCCEGNPTAPWGGSEASCQRPDQLASHVSELLWK